MKNLIKTFVFFALTILLSSTVYAQYDIPDPTPAVRLCSNTVPESIKSPSGACGYWRSSAVCILDKREVSIYESADDCKVVALNATLGTYHFYYSGNEYCSENNIGTPYHSKKCVLRTDITQPTSIPTPSEKSKTQLEIEQKKAESLMNENDAKLKKETKRIDDMMRQRNEKDAANSQINELKTFNDTLKNLLDNVGTTLKNWAGAFFDGIKNIFKK